MRPEKAVDRWRWKGETWPHKGWLEEFMRRRDLTPRHWGTVRAAQRNYLRNRVRI